MESFIKSNTESNKYDDKCDNSNLVDDVGITNYLRKIAVYATILNQDSPLGNGNNHYLAYTGSNTSLVWAMLQYDQNCIISQTN